MSEEQVEQEVVQEEQNAAEEVQTPQPQNTSQDRNWREATAVMAQQKAELEAYKAKMALLEQQMHATTRKEEEVDEFAGISKDELLTFEQANKLAEKKAEKTAKRLIEQYQNQQDERMRQERLTSSEEVARAKYTDYDYVLENFALPQIKNDPALAHKIQMSKNPAEAAYKLGKLADSYEDQMTKQQTSTKAEKILKNSSRPTSANAVTPSLKTQADDVSKMSQDQIWQMSQKYARQA